MRRLQLTLDRTASTKCSGVQYLPHAQQRFEDIRFFLCDAFHQGGGDESSHLFLLTKKKKILWILRFIIRKGTEFYYARTRASASHVWCTCNMHRKLLLSFKSFPSLFLVFIRVVGGHLFEQQKNMDWFPRVITNVLLGSEHIPSLRFQLYTLSFVRFLSSNNSARAIRFGSDEKLRTTSIWKSKTIVKSFIPWLFSQIIFVVDVTKCSKVFSLNFNT